MGKVICNAANDLVRLRAVERPGLAVGPKHRNLHRDRLGLALDGELEQAIGCLRRGEDSAQLDARVNVLELLPVDRLDDLPLLEFPGRGGRRTFLDVRDSNDEGRLEQVDPHAYGAEALDVGERFGFARARGEEAAGILVEGFPRRPGKWLGRKGN